MVESLVKAISFGLWERVQADPIPGRTEVKNLARDSQLFIGKE